MGLLYADDNEISVDQSGATANIDLEQLGSGNIIGGADAIAGTMTPLDLDGGTMTLDINQIGSSNQFLGDIFADTFTGFFEFDGDSNIFNITVDPTDTYGADSGNFNVNVTGNSNEFDLDVATAAMASTLDLDWIINGSSNDLTFTIDYDLATNYMPKSIFNDKKLVLELVKLDTDIISLIGEKLKKDKKFMKKIWE